MEDRTLQDLDPLLEPGSTADSVPVTLLLQFCEGVSELEARWRELPGAGGFLEELQIMDLDWRRRSPGEIRPHLWSSTRTLVLVLLMRQCMVSPLKGTYRKFGAAVPADPKSCFSESEEEEEFFKGKGPKGPIEGQAERQAKEARPPCTGIAHHPAFRGQGCGGAAGC